MVGRLGAHAQPLVAEQLDEQIDAVAMAVGAQRLGECQAHLPLLVARQPAEGTRALLGVAEFERSQRHGRRLPRLGALRDLLEGHADGIAFQTEVEHRVDDRAALVAHRLRERPRHLLPRRVVAARLDSAPRAASRPCSEFLSNGARSDEVLACAAASSSAVCA